MRRRDHFLAPAVFEHSPRSDERQGFIFRVVSVDQDRGVSGQHIFGRRLGDYGSRMGCVGGAVSKRSPEGDSHERAKRDGGDVDLHWKWFSSALTLARLYSFVNDFTCPYGVIMAQLDFAIQPCKIAPTPRKRGELFESLIQENVFKFFGVLLTRDVEECASTKSILTMIHSLHLISK